MQRRRWSGAAAAVVAVGVGVASVVGCQNRADDPKLNFMCPNGEVCPSSGMGGASSSSSSSGTPPGCVPNMISTAVAEDCGVFVSSSLGMDSNPGTKTAPVQTLAHAVDVAMTAGGKPIYACAEDFPGSLTLSTGATIYGGLDCTMDWAYDTTKKSGLVGDADKAALTVELSASGTTIADFTITAPNATMAGGSSIAVVVDGAITELDRCDLIAGDAMAGLPGDPYPTAAQAGLPGLPGGDACSADTVAGGIGPTNTCGADVSVGGDGGNGKTASGAPGGAGSPGATMNGGAGEGVSGCTPGTVGDVGTAGAPGTGGTGKGTITNMGYTGMVGMPGSAGGPGQGGGGGGGAKGGTGANQCLVGKAGGASGGSGGSGGCGGLGGNLGSAGGSSIGLISINASMNFTGVAISTGNGGAGGDGGPGQDGGLGAPPGLGGKAPAGLKAGCSGGNGGSGGKGGKGGGGQGGHAIGIAYTGTTPPMATFAKAGTPGTGGAGADMAHNGRDGMGMPTLVFP